MGRMHTQMGTPGTCRRYTCMEEIFFYGITIDVEHCGSGARVARQAHNLNISECNSHIRNQLSLPCSDSGSPLDCLSSRSGSIPLQGANASFS